MFKYLTITGLARNSQVFKESMNNEFIVYPNNNLKVKIIL